MSVGDRLAEAREAAGMSVEDVAERTRIRATLIRALEADDVAVCGGSAYARGHVRSIARVVGADPAPLLEAYDAEHGSPIPVLPTLGFDPEVAESTRQRRPNWAAAMAAALVVVCVLAAVQLVRGGGGHPSAPTAEVRSRPAASPTAAPRPTSAPTGALAFVNPKVVTLRVRVLRRKSWVAVTNAAHRTVFQGVLAAGSQQDFTDPRGLRIVIGDSGAVALVVNGHDLGSPGPAGRVSALSFVPGDPTAQNG